jgi:hypothetical protein
MVQAVLLAGPTAMTTSGRRHQAEVDSGQMLLTGRSWTGTRTINLARLSRVSRVRLHYRSEYSAGRTVDYVICADSTGARLALSRQAAAEPVRRALAFQRKHNLPTARVSRFAAMGLQLAPDSLRFRFVRGLVVCAAVIAYVAAVGGLIVVVIPALAPGH